MGAPAIYQPGNPQPLAPLPAPDPGAFGGDIARGLGELGGAVGQYAQVAQQLDREKQSFDFQKQSADAVVANAQYSEQLKTSLPAGAPGYAKAVQDHFDGQMSPLLDGVTDPQLRMRLAAQVAQQRADTALRAQAYEQAQGATKIATDAEQASSTRAAGLYLDPSWASLQLVRQQNAAMYSQSTLLDGNQKEQGARQANAQAFHQGFMGLLEQHRFDEAGHWLSSPEAAELGKEQLPALGEQLRVAQHTFASQTTAANTQAFIQQIKTLDLTGQQYEQGRPSFEQATTLASQYQSLSVAGATAEQKAEALQKFQTWHGKAVEIGASEQFRGATPLERSRIIADLAAKPTLTPEEGAALKGLQGQQAYVNGLSTLDRYTYSTGQAVPEIDINKPQSVQQRIAIWQAAQAKFGGAPDFLLPQEAQKLKESIKSGDVDHKIAAFQFVTSLPGPAARQTLDTLTQGDDAMRATASLAAPSFNDGGERLRLALQGIEYQKANKEIWTRQVDLDKKPLGPDRDQLWASWAPALAGLPAQTQATLRANTFNIYAGSAGKMGWNSFHPDEAARSLRFAAGGGKVNGSDAGGLGSLNGQIILLPNDMGQREFETRMARASPQSWGFASVNGVAWAGNRPLTTGEARSMTPVAVDPHRGLYQLKQGNATITLKDGVTPYVFDIHKLVDMGPLQHLSEPDPQLRQLRERVIR